MVSYEVEFKARVSHEAIRPRLSALGAQFDGSVRQVDTYFDAPDRDFGETDEALRLRRETVDGETTAELTYKGPLVDDTSKTRRELETAVGDPDVAATILDELGFGSVAVVEKHRERYRLGDYTLTLDSVAELGEFLEIERSVGPESVAAARAGARSTLRELGLDPDETTRRSYLGMLLSGA